MSGGLGTIQASLHAAIGLELGFVVITQMSAKFVQAVSTQATRLAYHRQCLSLTMSHTNTVLLYGCSNEMLYRGPYS
jgi:hypothetical protein